jgi:perosamine synthetase
MKYVTDCLRSGWVSSLGEYITMFEKKFSHYCGCGFGVSCSNGTVALHLALSALGIKEGDEVIVPSLTFIATANAVHYTGAKPVFVDSEPSTWNIDPDKIEEKITKRTKAIIPVHLYGHPCNMNPIMDIAKENNLYVIEDAAEAHGAEYNGKKTGGIGDLACFSFYGNKIITTGEGGMLVTNNEEIAKRSKLLRDQGMSKEKRYWHEIVGYNYRLTNLQAALGVAQLERIDNFIEIKRCNARLYNSFLKNVRGVVLPPEEEWAKNVYWMYSVLVEKEFGITRDQLMKKLMDLGIDTRPFFYPINTQPPYYRDDDECRVSEELSVKGINLPSSVKLRKKDIEYVARAIINAREQ